MKLLSVAWKDLQILLKDWGTLLMLFLLPFVFILAFSISDLAGVSEEEGLMTLPVVNLDAGSGASQALIDDLNGVGGVQVKEYEQRDEALDLLEEREFDWLLEIPAGFSAMGEEHRVVLNLVTHPDADKNETESIYRVVNGVAQDMSLEVQLLDGFKQMGRMMAAVPEGQRAFTSESVRRQAQEQFERSTTRPLVVVEQTLPTAGEGEEMLYAGIQLSIPGFTVLFVFLTAQTTAQSIFQEKKQGSFRRLLAAPMSKATLLVGKMLPSLITTLLQIVVIFAVGMFVLPLIGLDRLTLGHDPLALVLVSIILALCSTGLGLLIAAIARTEGQISGLSALALWVMGALGGSFIPTFLLGDFLGTISSVVPHGWALRAYNGLLVRGWGFADVTTEMAVLLGFTVAFFVIGMWRFDFD